jgi:hypothetical protein
MLRREKHPKNEVVVPKEEEEEEEEEESVLNCNFLYFNTMYHASLIILYYDQQMHNYLTNYQIPTCFDTVVSSSDSL